MSIFTILLQGAFIGALFRLVYSMGWTEKEAYYIP